MRARPLNAGQVALRNASLSGGRRGLRPTAMQGATPYGSVGCPPACGGVGPLRTPSGAPPWFAPCIAVARHERQRGSILPIGVAPQLPLAAKRRTPERGARPGGLPSLLRRAPLASYLDTPLVMDIEPLSLRPREKPSQGPAPTGPFLLILDRYR